MQACTFAFKACHNQHLKRLKTHHLIHDVMKTCTQGTRKQVKIFISSLILLLVTTSCALFKPIPDSLTLSINTASDVNPDAEGRASPIVFRIYQLADSKAFKEKDFFDIFDEDQESLAKSLISSEEMELKPNESQAVVLKLDKNTRYLGFLAAYRNLESAKWREVKAVTSKTASGIPLFGKQGFTINLNKDKIMITGF